MFWDLESLQESKALFLKIYELKTDLRRHMINLVVAGPKYFNSAIDQDKIKIENHQCEVLEELTKNKYQIFDDGRGYLKQIYIKHPEWKPKTKKIGKRQVKKKNIDKMSPEEIINEFLINKPNDPYINRRAPETIGVRCSKQYSFCKDLFELFIKYKGYLTSSFLSPIIWGLRPDEDTNEITWSIEDRNDFVSLLEMLIENIPDAEIWNSLPSLFERWQKIMGTIPPSWHGFLLRLAILLQKFDYEREITEKPIEWIQLAINHPYGKLTEIYLQIAIDEINKRKEEGKKLCLSNNIISFFDFTIKNYASGTRYGLCLIARNLNWLMSIEQSWVNTTLYPQFVKKYKSEAFLVAWSGYLWSNSISPSLIEQMNSSYKKISEIFEELGRDDKQGYAGHIAYISWINKIKIQDLFFILDQMDHEGRKQLIHYWRNHLEHSDSNENFVFWNKVLFPVWKWMSTKDFFNQEKIDTDNMIIPKEKSDLRFDFWKLIKYSRNMFPKAVEFAIKYAPQKIDHPGRLEDILNTEYIIKFPKEYVDLAMEILNVTENVIWQKNEWIEQWSKLKSLKVRKINKLKNRLAEKGIL